MKFKSIILDEGRLTLEAYRKMLTSKSASRAVFSLRCIGSNIHTVGDGLRTVAQLIFSGVGLQCPTNMTDIIIDNVWGRGLATYMGNLAKEMA